LWFCAGLVVVGCLSVRFLLEARPVGLGCAVFAGEFGLEWLIGRAMVGKRILRLFVTNTAVGGIVLAFGFAVIFRFSRLLAVLFVVV